MIEYHTAKISFGTRNPIHKYIIRLDTKHNTFTVAFIDCNREYKIEDMNHFRLLKEIKL